MQPEQEDLYFHENETLAFYEKASNNQFPAMDQFSKLIEEKPMYNFFNKGKRT